MKSGTDVILQFEPFTGCSVENYLLDHSHNKFTAEIKLVSLSLHGETKTSRIGN